jgi:hypothetical protein
VPLTFAVSQMENIWQISASELVQLETLGSGAWGDVLRCDWGQRIVAVKRLHGKDALDNFTMRNFEKFSCDLRALRHPNLALYFGAGSFVEGTCLCQVVLTSTQAKCSSCTSSSATPAP